MAAPPNLVVVMTFNPPIVKIIGPVQAETISKLEEAFPASCTTDPRGRKPPAKFEYREGAEPQPPHWSINLYGNFCDNLGQMQLMLAMFEALEEEGDWTLKESSAIQLPEHDVHRFYFTKKL
eukprot:TRINITY_DN26813_c0_g1_i1.p1 TRINITY_DN26813_c0_g1~~TRINITY_DN26813_c0_g1_i1.p1  ORF type:complete len:122 (+),score=35.81 TRINITY_DN26813_c0_g1_i1:71-436(+)